MKILHDKDADLSVLDGKTVAVIGYGSQGSAQALCMRDSGVKVIVGSIKDESYDKAVEDGFQVMPIAEAAAIGDIIHILLPDEYHGPVYQSEIKDNLKPGAALSCSHGFNIVYKQIVPPENVDVIMVAPKSPATEERKAFLQGFGVPGLIAIGQDASGNARAIALAMAKAMGFTRAGCLECTFEEETYEDLFGEQNVLCGGCVDLIKYGFEVLTEAGYPPEMAYFECLHELKLIVDLMYEGGIARMNYSVSDTAEYGGYLSGPRVIDADTKGRMRQILTEIQDGTFVKRLVANMEGGNEELEGLRKKNAEHPIEVTGKKLRELMSWVDRPLTDTA